MGGAWEIFTGMPSDKESSSLRVEMGRTEHESIFGEIDAGKFPHSSRLSDWGNSPHYCASSVADLVSELGLISAREGKRGSKIESVLSLAVRAEQSGVPVSVAGGNKES